MEKTIKLLACSKNGKLYKTTTGKIYSRHKLISLIKNNKAIVKTSSGTEVSIFSYKGKEFLRSNHNNKERDNLSETLLPFNVLKHHSWLLASLFCLGIIASNVVYPLIILDERKTHKTELSSFITEIDLGEIETDTAPAIQSRVVELNSSANDLNWSQLTFTQITPTSAHIDAKNDSKLYSGHVNVVFSIPPVIEYNVEGTNWPGYINGAINYTTNDSDHTYTINNSASSYAANNLIIPNTVISNGVSYAVTTIGYEAFLNDAGLTGTLTIPDSVISIKTAAFYQLSGLIGDLIIPSSVISIETFAFYHCTGFTGSLIFQGSGISIGDTAFNGCSGFNVISAAFTSAPELGRGPFVQWGENGTVQNTGAGYSSEQLLAFLKTNGLPPGWTVAI